MPLSPFPPTTATLPTSGLSLSPSTQLPGPFLRPHIPTPHHIAAAYPRLRSAPGFSKTLDLKDVKIMEGGMEAWTKAGLPVVTPDATPSGAKWGAFSLVGKTAVVTGGASGIGCAIATLFASKVHHACML